MAKQKEGVYEKVLECAKAEFLEKGYKDASLRTIAKEAGTSTGSIYTRFKDKDGLFGRIVEPVVNGIKEWFLAVQDVFDKKEVQEKEKMHEYTEPKQEEFCNYIFDNRDIFELLILKSDGTRFSDFIHELVEIEVEYTLRYIKSTSNDAISSGRVTIEMIHVITSGYYAALFETITHHMEREEALHYARQLQRFYQCGWSDALGIANDP